MARRVWVKSRRVRGGGYWRTVRGSRKRTAQLTKARTKQRHRVAMSRRSVTPGSPSVEMGVQLRRAQARGHRVHLKGGEIKVRRKRRRRGR